ncbi:exodeoxyribonuclease III [Patescibacteria group bacterium]|nr:exodeoxyribonuclease III [Patescibacteria group bacterium]
MKEYKIISWNVNGIRAIFKKGIDDFLLNTDPDILCFQEIKAEENQITELPKHLTTYYSVYSSAEKKGYSGTVTYSKNKPLFTKLGLEDDKFNTEGRVIESSFDKFTLFNIYFPNGQKDDTRLNFKLDFYTHLTDLIKTKILNNEKIIIVGDFNTAYSEIDLARPKENEKNSGFLPQERKALKKLLQIGLIDSFRFFNKEGGNYTWWDPVTRARERNVGWRIDYIYISENLKKNLKNAFILNEVYGSDHCPVGIELKF